MEAKAGDLVKVSTKDEVFEGILMPRPEILDKDVTVVKLGSGYNIGIDNKKIKKVELIKGYKPKKGTKTTIKPKKGLPNVTIISTGGTISSKVDYKTGGTVAEYTAEDFIEMVPELSDIANLKAKKIMSVMSEDLTSKDWILIANEVAKELNSGADGVVVTQGTDTLHFTASALSFLLEDLSKPVIVTGAQRSIDRGSSDAFMNLLCAVSAAAKSGIAEVMTCLHGTTNDDYCLLIRGTKVRKMHTSRRDAFRPINELPFAKVHEGGKIEILNNNFRKKSSSKVKSSSKFGEKVGLLYTYPGIRAEVLDAYKNYEGLVIVATGLGNIPSAFFNKIKELNIPIAISTQTLYGRVHPLVYANLRELSIKFSCVFVEDMSPETTYVKLGYVLGQTKDKDKVKELMLTNIAGEITDRSDEKTFLY